MFWFQGFPEVNSFGNASHILYITKIARSCQYVGLIFCDRLSVCRFSSVNVYGPHYCVARSLRSFLPCSILCVALGLSISSAFAQSISTQVFCTLEYSKKKRFKIPACIWKGWYGLQSGENRLTALPRLGQRKTIRSLSWVNYSRTAVTTKLFTSANKRWEQMSANKAPSNTLRKRYIGCQLSM